MKKNTTFAVAISLIVSLGGFLLGFDSAVISGAAPFYQNYFQLPSGSLLLGISVSAIIAGAMIGNSIAGWLADLNGRKTMLKITAILFAVCELNTAFSNNIAYFITARIIGGIGVGMAILIAPMYIAEIAPKKLRGTLVTFNQLNIVVGISLAYFSNYYLLHRISDPAVIWRWMLGVSLVPSTLYFILLFFVPSSPRWLVQVNKDEQAKKVLSKINGSDEAEIVYKEIKSNIENRIHEEKASLREVFSKKMKVVLIIGFGMAFFQQITGINAIFYYAPLIFEMTGGGKDAAFVQAIIIGLTNVVMTLVSMALIDRLGRKPLLIIGSIGIMLSLSLAGLAFKNASYTLKKDSIVKIEKSVLENEKYKDQALAIVAALNQLTDKEYKSETVFFKEIKEKVGPANYNNFKETILRNSIKINSILVLIGLMCYVASFAISLGPVMWALLSEIFPNKLRGIAISVVGLWNSVVSFSVATIFPVELEHIGSGMTYFVYAIFGFLTLLFVLKYVPETKGKSLEEIEAALVK